MGMLIILNSYQIACKVSIPTSMATNSAPNTDVSTVDCFLKYQTINDMFMYIMNLVLGIVVRLLNELLLSMNIHRSTSFPLKVGALGGIASTASSEKSVQSHSQKVL